MARFSKATVLAQAPKQVDVKRKPPAPPAQAAAAAASGGPAADRPTASPHASVAHLSLRQVLILGAGVRLALFRWLPAALLAVLADRPELGSPLTSFRRLREGVFLLSRGVDPYDGGLVLLSPLQLHFASVLLPPSSALLTALAWSSADLAGAYALGQLWHRRVRDSAEPVAGRRHWEAVVAFLFLFNPYTLLTALARSTTTFDNALVLLSLALAANARAAPALFLLALATRTALYPALLLPAVLLFLPSPPSFFAPSTPTRLLARKAASRAALFAAFVAGLAMVERALAGSWAAVFQGWRTVVGIRDLTPNVGLSWYFFTEMFEHFRPFFVVVFQAHTLIYVVPLCLAFQADPLFAVLGQLWIVATLQTFPTLGATALSVALLPLFPSLIPHFSRPLIPIGLHVYAALLFPILHHLWLHAGSANANFFYAAGLVAGLGNVLCGVELVWVGRKRAFLRAEGLEGEPGWEVVQVTD